jgi:death-on-curing protein
MRITLYPTLNEVIELHQQLLKRFGEKTGVRDYGLLESALWRPQTGYYQSLSLQAAALLQSLSQNPPFIDGNKRVAFATTAIFLRMNGFRLKVTADDGESFLLDRGIQGRAPIEEISQWIERHMVAAR